MAPRIVDIDAYMPVLRELLAQGQSVCLTVTGESMSPFLRHGRDQVLLECVTAPPGRGDMVLFQRRGGQYIMHRILRRLPDGNYALIGDGQQQVEMPIATQQIFAVVTQVCRKGKWIGSESFWWRFFAGPWLMLLPLRPVLRHMARWIPASLK